MLVWCRRVLYSVYCCKLWWLFTQSPAVSYMQCWLLSQFSNAMQRLDILAALLYIFSRYIITSNTFRLNVSAALLSFFCLFSVFYFFCCCRRLYEALILSTLLYSAELWPHTVTLSKKLEAAHHRWLRGILCITWRDSHKWGGTEKNRTSSSREGDPRKKIAMARSCHKNGWSTHSKASTTVGSSRIQERTWQTKDKLERYSE